MKNSHTKKMYLREFELYDGEAFITFNIVDIDTAKGEITLAVTNRGRINILTYDLLSDSTGAYFEYGCCCEKVRIDDFEEIAQ